MSLPIIPTLSDPQLIDLAIQPIQARLETLSWMTKAFGKAQRLNRIKESRNHFKPAIYYGGNDGQQYAPLFPNSEFGNFCFFDVKDKRKTASETDKQTIEFGIVFWFDFREVYPNDYLTKTTENVINDVLNVLKLTRVKTGVISELVENIYPKYDITEIDNQFLMRPFGGFRIDGILNFDQLC